MLDVIDTCPKCGLANPHGKPICRGCQLVFAKWIAHQELQQSGKHATRTLESSDTSPWFRHPGKVNPIELIARAVTLALLCCWTVWFITTDHTVLIRGLPEINYSIMHTINLVFHEAGHLIFMPLGRFMMVAGGSLMQLIVPAVVLWAFVFRNANPFGGVVAAWWFGQSMMDLAPYIFDARAQAMLLLGGGTGRDRPGSHDWNNLLRDMGLLDNYRSVAWLVDALAALIMIAALIWGLRVLLHQYHKLKNPEMDLETDQASEA